MCLNGSSVLLLNPVAVVVVVVVAVLVQLDRWKEREGTEGEMARRASELVLALARNKHGFRACNLRLVDSFCSASTSQLDVYFTFFKHPTGCSRLHARGASAILCQ